ncbi:UDP-N-acetylmuramoyl-L-alanyl-D-glutamate--2,6-diaminopimelate ligase [Psychrobacillus sp. FSL K6-1267]|uniref:UDP-N-acetylmuramoyl-L-alanyl-D-glutamate--2, 6-diaminopimelate ligase n=1 Tax=Psychrobacillus sp. FSL K6-1267 TaxID=2921543 RepID=UPI0030F596AD
MEYKIFGDLSGLTIDRFIDHSKQIQIGDVFVSESNNRAYIEEAIQNGAKIVITKYYVSDCSIPQIVLPSDMCLLQDKIAYLTHKMYGQKIKTVGITGTNGKTTVASFTGQLLMQQNKSVCVVGTLGVFVNGNKLEKQFRSNTTLPFYDFIQVVRYCYEHDVEYIVLEASSQGLLDNRLGSYPMDIAVFLNIGKDHLEFHGGMVPYKKSKELLIPLAKQLVINNNDEWCRSVAQKSYIPTIRFGDREENDVFFKREKHLDENVKYEYDVNGRKTEVTMRNSGYHNGMNLAAAIGVMLGLGISCESIKPVSLPAGRLQRVENKMGIEVLIDYAHTPDALEACLSSIHSYAKHNIYVVFGCGGNRDKQKRKSMGEVASKYATKAIVTSDNPRNEKPEAIIADIVQGMVPSKVIVEINRRKAIELALATAKVGDVVLVAGKGHEKEQIIKDVVLPFSDVEVVHSYFKEMDVGVITKNDPVA